MATENKSTVNTSSIDKKIDSSDIPETSSAFWDEATGAELSQCRKYRYALWRIWDNSKPYAMFIGLNPSTANETQNDYTINCCISYARSWGYGGLCMGNLFAFRATYPRVMKSSTDPIGSDNDAWLIKLSKKAGIIVVVWGNDGSHMGRSRSVVDMIPNLMCLGINDTGEPTHPIRASIHAKPIKIGTST